MPDAGGGASPSSPEKREEEEEEAEEAPPGKAGKPPAPPAAEEQQQPTPRKMRLPRACNSKPKPPPPPPPERPRRRAAAAAAAAAGGADDTPQCRVVTPLVSEPEAPAELPRWRLRCMWELGSVLNFLHVRASRPPSVLVLPPLFLTGAVLWTLGSLGSVPCCGLWRYVRVDATVALFCLLQVFRPLLNITAEFTAEDLEAALITPNDVLDDVHMPLLKVSRAPWLSACFKLFSYSATSVSVCVGWVRALLLVFAVLCSSIHNQIY
jgi:hypothetical protein